MLVLANTFYGCVSSVFFAVMRRFLLLYGRMTNTIMKFEKKRFQCIGFLRLPCNSKIKKITKNRCLEQKKIHYRNERRGTYIHIHWRFSFNS